jgi:hypothetical protein
VPAPGDPLGDCLSWTLPFHDQRASQNVLERSWKEGTGTSAECSSCADLDTRQSLTLNTHHSRCLSNLTRKDGPDAHHPAHINSIIVDLSACCLMPFCADMLISLVLNDCVVRIWDTCSRRVSHPPALTQPQQTHSSLDLHAGPARWSLDSGPFANCPTDAVFLLSPHDDSWSP